ncbi:MFS transporter [Terriglobus roseus]|uniref:MFS transporter, ACS family, glucarate transporter n=1 Tax=Terriglobus roseus TaxID=392734 RepID=A0A1H4IZ55_9BACT|nr:MFS transporter [Terriglobus roseus]SEB39095.1 MFS transporter, ACS family, glucarate transporter [Terriglobus roseus]
MVPKASSVRVRYLLGFLLFLLSGIAFLDRTNISIAGPQISREFALGHERLGWIFSAFLIGYALMQVPAGWMAARFGPRSVLTVGTLWWGVATILATLLPVGTPTAVFWLIALRFLLGAGESVVYPAANQFVSNWIPAGERGIINGLIFAGVGAGSGLTPPLLNWIITQHGWRAAFWFSALLGALIGCIWWFASRNMPEQHPSVSSEELQEIRAGITTDSPAEIAAAPKVQWKAMFTRKDLPLLMSAYFCFGYISWIYFSWFFTYMSEVRGFNPKSSALFTMLPFISMTFFCLLGGALSDRITRRFGLRAGRCWLASGALCLTACFLVFGSQAKNPVTAAIILSFGAGALYLSQSSFWSVSIDIAGKQSGVFSSLVNTGGQVGGAVTASLTPWIAHGFGWTSSFGTAACMALLGATCWALVNPAPVPARNA